MSRLLALALALSLAAPAAAGPVEDLTAHTGDIDLDYVRSHGVPSSWPRLMEVDPVRAAAWRAWLADPELAAEVHAARIAPQRRGVGLTTSPVDPRMAPVYLDIAVHGDVSPDTRGAMARTGAALATELPVLEAAFARAEAPVRAAIASGLATAEPALARPILTAALADPDPTVRTVAASVIGRRDDAPDHLDGLRRATIDPEAEVRRLALRALGWHAMTAAVPECDAAVGDLDPKVRIAALHALERLDPGRARARAADLRTDRDQAVATAAERLLARPVP